MRVSAKRILSAMVGALMLSGNAFAMTFSQPEPIGHVYPDIAGFYGNGFMIEGAADNQGISRTGTRKDRCSYEKGIAQFGIGLDSLYVHYEIKPSPSFWFGSKEISNTVKGVIHGGFRLYRINTNENIIFYAADLADEGANDIIVFSRREDGRYVKYFDTDAVKQQYFGSNHVSYDKLSINGDVIVIPYHVYAYNPYHKIGQGEFRYKWDDDAQWFGVEQVVY